MTDEKNIAPNDAKIDYSYEVKHRRQELVDEMEHLLEKHPELHKKLLNYIQSYEKFQNEYIDCARRNIKLEKISHARTRAVMEVSHELKAPITSVMSMLNVIKEGYVPDAEKQKEMIGRAHHRLSEMVTLVKDLLHLSQTELQPETIPMEPVELGPLVTKLVEDYTPDMIANDVVPCINVQPDMPKVMANQAMIGRVIENLISNGIKYNNPGGKLCVNIGQIEEGRVHVCVKDEGKGMSEEELSNLFNLFYRGKNQSKLKKEGSGLGLSFTKRIVEAHGSSLHVESEVGTGTFFCFDLKAIDE
ncbi:MAG: sensor histidine kinase [Candidatus Zixiibacteriota bacterium]